MKKIYIYLLLFTSFLGAGSCDQNFEEINTNPNAATDLDPVYLFNNAQFGASRVTHHYQGAIVQQVNTPLTGLIEAGNHNIINENNIFPLFNDLYQGPIRNLVTVIERTKDNPAQSNLYNMARILKAYDFMVLVDTYGDLPYFEAGKGFIESTYRPKYDPQAAIYEDILKELEEATNLLDVSKPAITGGDIFYNGNVGQWKKLGNSLLLRAGMRYTELDENKAKQIVQKAVDPARGGVMTTNADNALVRHNATYTNATSAQLTSTERQNYFVGEPFVDFLKTTNDPRMPYIVAKYSVPTDPVGGTMNTNPADQVGLPYGYTDVTIVNAPGYLGSLSAYSQFRRNTVLRLEAPEHLVTHAQTQLLLAEAVTRGYITGDAKVYYETGIKAHMDQMKDYEASIDITEDQKNAYLQGPEVAFDPSRALEQINEQYWVASFRNWSEAWANFRRSGYPELKPVNYPGEDPAVDDPKYNAQGFIRRLTYPVRELSANTENVQEAIERMGGNTLGNRIFWDKN